MSADAFESLSATESRSATLEHLRTTLDSSSPIHAGRSATRWPGR
jgi:hypothetical protein